MINSQYILDIFELSVDYHSESNLLRNQIPFLTITEIEHTGIGAFFYFSFDNNIQQFKLDTNEITQFNIEGDSSETFEGIEIIIPELSILADTLIHLTNGIIDCLEIFNKCGEQYVKTDPEHYKFVQNWANITKNRTILR